MQAYSQMITKTVNIFNLALRIRGNFGTKKKVIFEFGLVLRCAFVLILCFT